MDYWHSHNRMTPDLDPVRGAILRNATSNAKNRVGDEDLLSWNPLPMALKKTEHPGRNALLSCLHEILTKDGQI